MAVVVLGNAVGLAANVAAAVHFQKAADAASTASALFAANSTQVALKSDSLMQTETELAVSIASVQSFCEVAVLLIIVAAFIVAGGVCARLLSFGLRAAYAASAPAAAVGVLMHYRRQMVVTTVVVFVASVVRSVQSTMFAVARQLQDVSRTCPGTTLFCDASCNNVFTHMFVWMVRTPEFQVTVVLVSSPLTLLVALWGMTTRLALHLMKPDKSEMESATVRQRDLLARERGRS